MRNKFHLYNIVTIIRCFKPGGGLRKYNLGRDVPAQTWKIDPFLYQMLPKNETHFYTEPQILNKIYLKFHIFPKLLSFQRNFDIRLMKLDLFSRQF